MRFAATLALMLTMALTAGAALPQQSGKPLEGYSEQQVRARLNDRALHRIEGLWQLVPSGATIVIERSEVTPATTYRMTVVKDASLGLQPGSVIGEIVAGGDPDIYEANIYTVEKEGYLMSPRKFTVALDHASGRMEFRRHRSTYRINLWHFVPFLWRYSVRRNDNEKGYFPGAIRLYPSPAVPIEPVYL